MLPGVMLHMSKLILLQNMRFRLIIRLYFPMLNQGELIDMLRKPAPPN